MCNGVKDCPDGEDEDSLVWGTKEDLSDVEVMSYKYLQHVRNWSHANPDIVCFPSNTSLPASTIILIVIVVLGFIALLPAIILVRNVFF